MAITAGDEASIETQLLLLIVNPYSNKKQDAIRYLEYLASKRTNEDYAMFETMTEPAINPAIHQQYLEACEMLETEQAHTQAEPENQERRDALLMLEDHVVALELQQVLITEQAIERYHALSSSFVVLMDADITHGQKMSTLISRVLDGNYPVEKFAVEADQYMRMMVEE